VGIVGMSCRPFLRGLAHAYACPLIFATLTCDTPDNAEAGRTRIIRMRPASVRPVLCGLRSADRASEIR
jgi:hypothetical protein